MNNTFHTKYTLYKVKYFDTQLGKNNHVLVAARDFDTAVAIVKLFVNNELIITKVQECQTTTILIQVEQDDD